MGWYAEWIRRRGHARWFAAFGSKVAPRVDRVLYRLSGGRLVATGPAVFPTLLLTTVGRKSGQNRTVPLLYVRDGDNLLVAGSNWGQKEEPAWARNLSGNPRARVQIGSARREYVARVATDEEKTGLWPKLDEMWPAYDTYRKRSGRDIKVFVLEPASPPAT
jgi:deazaflavin-dependent oxidoreductase (nitroreductase family)